MYQIVIEKDREIITCSVCVCARVNEIIKL